MKDITSFILENKKIFTLTPSERNALEDTIGIALGNLGKDKDIKQFKKFIDSLSDEEKEDLESLYDALSNTEDYKKINQKNIMPEEISLIDKLYHYCDDNDLLDDKWDLMDAFEKICD